MDITELENYFKGVTLPQTLQLDQASRITDVKAFVTSHLDTLKANGDNPAFSAFRDRLLKVKEILSTQ